jgi:hypothetical protein
LRFRSSLWLYPLVALTLASCAPRAPAVNPFKVPQADIKAKVKVIALAPVNLPGDIDDAEPVKAKFESLITAKLTAAGYKVVPSSEYAAVWKQITESLGGFFDPLTGKRDDKKVKTAREHAVREVTAKTKADAVFDAVINVVKVNFGNNRAAWHGTTEPLMTGGAWSSFFNGPYQGTVGALSLFVALSDANDVDMYLNAGGIQVLSKLSGRNFTPVPRHELFANEARNQRAVDVALAPLLDQAVAPAGSSLYEEP